MHAIAADFPYTATAVLDIVYPGPPAMRMPTAAAVAADGSIYVADGINDRVLQFDARGQFIQQIESVGDQRLARPMSVAVDPQNRLWIADAGNQRILLRNPDGGLNAALHPPAEPAGVDLTGLALTPDGRTAWLADNDHHRLFKYDTQSGSFSSIGERGESLGQFQFPFQLACNKNGDVFVTDVINGRGQGLSAAGRAFAAIGSYGVELGNLYRPNGIALDAAGNIWISDGRLGVIQVFNPAGAVLDVLRDRAGQPLHFDGPCGLTFDDAGDLYLVELSADRVRKLTVQANPTAPPPASPPPQARVGAAQPQSCSVCHLEWVHPFDQGKSTALADPPPGTPDSPAVGRSDNCLSCHNGCVADARRSVWAEHGHRTHVQPPPDMTVPKHLPLVDGLIVCRTCHSAHTRAGAGNMLAEAVFLRVSQQPSELCAGCHAAFAAGLSTGTHPLGEMSITVPPALKHRRAQAQTNEITCMVCHAGHGTIYNALLVASPDNDALCLDCHTALQPALFSDETRSQHGRLPVLNPDQLAVAAAFHTRASPEQRLICSTCHRMHKAGQSQLLAFDPRQDACGACHTPQSPVSGTPHDLRTDFPDVPNVRGVTARAGGPCAGCHTGHQFGQTPAPSPLDPTGVCITCHAPGRLAADTTLGPVNHGATACASCHDPHQAKFGKFLPAPAFDICSSCHPDRVRLVGGPHDITRQPLVWPPVSQGTADRCLACHRPHGDEQTGLFRAGVAAGASRAESACLPCHRGSSSKAEGPRALLHPLTPEGIQSGINLPLKTAPGQATRITCDTCHDAHGGPDNAANLLRATAGSGADTLCFTCHTQMVNVTMIGHGPGSLALAGFPSEACQPCHVVHGDLQAVEQRYLWPKRLAAESGSPANPANYYCFACHREGGPVAPPRIATHPDVEMYNPNQPDAPGYLPLFDDQGRVSPTGRVVCRTCHLTHARATSAPLPAEAGAASQRELRALQWHIRSFVAGNVCTTCHGVDAIRRFIYFHDPARRIGPLNP